MTINIEKDKTMLKFIESKIKEQSAHNVKYIKVQGLKDSKGEIRKINHQINRNFGLVGPLTLSTPSERVHAIRWATVRESFVVETNVKRVVKETIASGIAETNKCTYCADVHGASIASAGDSQTSKAIANGTWKTIKDKKIKKIIEWSLNTRNPNAEIIKNPPFTKDEASEIIGTALVYHSTNRLVSIFLENSPLPSFLGSGIMKKSVLNFASKTLFRSMVMKKAIIGESLQFIRESKPSISNKWAKKVLPFSKVLDTEEMLLKEIEKEIIPKHLAGLFREKVTNWNGEEMPLGKGWLFQLTDHLNESDKAIVNIMLQSAFAPHTIMEDDIIAFRKVKPTDRELIEVCFWSIQIVTNKIGIWLTIPFQS